MKKQQNPNHTEIMNYRTFLLLCLKQIILLYSTGSLIHVSEAFSNPPREGNTDVYEAKLQRSERTLTKFLCSCLFWFLCFHTQMFLLKQQNAANSKAKQYSQLATQDSQLHFLKSNYI